MKKVILIAFLMLSLGANTAYAAVVLNEIAWMGSANSSSDEWIELYNNGTTTTDLTGWKITGKGGAQIVALSGEILPGSYFLIERSDDNTVPNVTADLVTTFGKGLSNDGETIKLLDGGKTVVDTVVGGKNWSKLGGDNVSKQTAQRTTFEWITAIATPKAQNKTPSLATEVTPPMKELPKTTISKVAHAETISKSVTQVNNSVSGSKGNGKIIPEKNLAENITATSAGANVIWQRKADAEAEKDAWAWMIFALTLVIVASFIIMRSNIYEPTEADKYAIIEDIIEGIEDEDTKRIGDY